MAIELGNLTDRDQAARCLQRSWRRSNARLDCLRKGKTAIAELHHKAFIRFSERVNPLLASNPERMKKMAKAAEQVLTERSDIQRRVSIPVFTSLGQPIRFTLHDHKEDFSQYYRMQDRYCYFTEKVYADFLNTSPPRTVKDLDKLLRMIRAQTDLIAWDYTRDGCDVRSQLVINLLILNGVPLESISQIGAIVPKEFRKPGIAQDWRFHIAPLVKLKDGSEWVIDPALCPTCAIRQQDWILLQMKSLCAAGIVDLGDMSERLAVHPDKEDCVHFRIAHNQHISPLLDDTYYIGEINEDLLKSHCERMGFYRLDLEKGAL